MEFRYISSSYNRAYVFWRLKFYLSMS